MREIHKKVKNTIITNKFTHMTLTGREATTLRVGFCNSTGVQSARSPLWSSQRLVRFGLLDMTVLDEAVASLPVPTINALSASDLFVHNVRIVAPALSFTLLSV